jgi:hypothetical protein
LRFVTTAPVVIRRDYLAGAHIEAVADFRNEGLAAADAEQRADDLIEEVMLVMANGKDWLRHRIALCERPGWRAQ